MNIPDWYLFSHILYLFIIIWKSIDRFINILHICVYIYMYISQHPLFNFYLHWNIKDNSIFHSNSYSQFVTNHPTLNASAEVSSQSLLLSLLPSQSQIASMPSPYTNSTLPFSISRPPPLLHVLLEEQFQDSCFPWLSSLKVDLGVCASGGQMSFACS